eukprot:TRINITY_DN991_c0_g1_i2.p1 TRINITY_DN991_c0_g1~~TRINITY_DN991_c0_g1_i2.p1  ORF type:complete len:660 (-),score=151.06 TRINITY_DN991_c0_g1_i2:251-2230(-)
MKEEELREVREQEKLEEDSANYGKSPEDKVDQIFSTGAATGVLTNDLLYIMEHSSDLGFSAEPINNNIYDWKVKIFGFQGGDLLRSMQEINETFGYDYVELRVEFKMDLYPFYPPLVTVIRPRFQGFMMGRITSMEMLKLDKWNPVRNMSEILTTIRELLSNFGKLDINHDMNNSFAFPGGAYTKLEHYLLQLELISEVTPRANKKYPIRKESMQYFSDIEEVPMVVEDKEEENDQQQTSGNNSNRVWAKGTGYGHGSRGNNSWNLEAYIAAQKERDLQHERVLKSIADYITKDILSFDEEVIVEQAIIVEESCLIPILISSFDNDSLLDMCSHESLYSSLLNVCKAIAQVPIMVPLLDRLPCEKVSVFSKVQKLRRTADIFNRAVSKSKAKEATEQVFINLILEVHALVETALGYEKNNGTSPVTDLINDGWKEIILEQAQKKEEMANKEEQYIDIMSELQFDYSDLEMGGYAHYFRNEASDVGSSSTKRVLRLGQEVGSLSGALPINASSSIFVRVDPERMDMMTCAITGPEDTPYSGGFFQFDIFFPKEYPGGPMKIWLITTGNQSFRFNPNLYANGKVCLSLLGTWSGSAGESWYSIIYVGTNCEGMKEPLLYYKHWFPFNHLLWYQNHISMNLVMNLRCLPQQEGKIIGNTIKI